MATGARSLVLALVVSGVAWALLVGPMGARAQAQMEEGEQVPEQQQQQHGPQNSTAASGSEDEREPGKHRSLIGLLLSPIKATFSRARRMLSSRLGGARDLVVSGFDELQTRTFRVFMRAYNKSYSPEELPRRMALFFERRKQIEQSLRDFASGALPFAMRENSFSDWDEAELRQLARASPPASPGEMTDEEREATQAAGGKLQRLELKTDAQSGGEFIELSTGADEDESEPAVNVSRGLPARRLPMDNYDESADERNMSVRAIERIPAQLDWRTSGCVATPRNQLKCGACYAIATVGAVESQRCINQVASSPVLSPQQVVDCSRAYNNYGCDGGWPTRTLRYLQDTQVIARESCYPFVRRTNTCRLRQVLAGGETKSCTVPASTTDASQLRYKVLSNERDILYHVAKTGPVVTVMRATDRFLYYGKGIFDDPKCSGRRDEVDHAIVIVGYGRENNQDYWLIKNSWGTDDWGEGGYGKYKRGTNACSIGHWAWVITG